MTARHDNWSRIERLLSLVTRLRPGEGHAALLFFLQAFLLLSSYQTVKALREAFMLTKFSAETRSYAVALMALVLMLVVPVYGWVRRRLEAAQLLRAVTIFFVVTLPLFAVLFHTGTSIALPFYIWVGIFGVMVVAQMWAFAADSFNVRSGQRLFVIIMLGGNLGALAGAKITNLAVATLSPLGLMILATLTLGSTLLVAGPARAAVPEASRATRSLQPAPRSPHLLGGLHLVLKDRYLITIAVFVILLNWINSTGEFILADYVKHHATTQLPPGASEEQLREYLASFYGDFQFWVTLVSLAIQLLLVARLYRTLGMRGALLIHPVIVTVGYGLLAFAPLLGGFIPIFSLIRRIKVTENGTDYSLTNTTRQSLFLPVDREAKYDGKMAIDTFFWRFGDLIQALSIYVGLNLLGWGTQQFAFMNLALSLAWMGLAVMMGRSYQRKALENMTNSPPEAVEPIPDLYCRPGHSFRHQVSTAAFRDADPGDVVTFHACCEDGKPLPRWLRFDAWRQTFSGTWPEHSRLEELRVAVIASDMEGLSARSAFAIRRSEESIDGLVSAHGGGRQFQ